MDEMQHQHYMARCLRLAKRGQGSVAPNPMVGAVLVHNDMIIGEGFHQQFGGAHAEVNCINAALQKSPERIAASTLYVSLEPCAHFGKTPPCTDLIVKHKIPKVVIACTDRFEKVDGLGIETLKQAGINVTTGVMEAEAMELNKRFFTFHTFKRPYIVLKWAQTLDGFIASDSKKRLFITNPITNRLVHKWRSEEAGILVGANTVMADNPLLDNRNWYGKPPVKIIIDPQLQYSNEFALFQKGEETFVVNYIKEAVDGQITFIKIHNDNILDELSQILYERGIQSLLIEGGKYTLQSFIDAGMWDEARVITNAKLSIGSGLSAPLLSGAEKTTEQFILNDRIEFFKSRNATSGLL